MPSNQVGPYDRPNNPGWLGAYVYHGLPVLVAECHGTGHIDCMVPEQVDDLERGI